MKILDCTLRDGGYYNDWDFDKNLVNAYLYAMAKAHIDYVELGFRNLPKNGFFGAFAYTTEKYLNEMILPEGPVYGVMVDAKSILDSGLSVKEAINLLFVKKSKSKIGLVRVAAHFNEVDKIGEIIRILNEYGYVVALNLMQAAGKSDQLIIEKIEFLEELKECIDVLYFADSLGNMGREDVARISSLIRTVWRGDIGVHAHDNMGQALDNTLTALSGGVSWLDCTVLGMGRGAGNAQTERLLAHLEKDGEQKYYSRAIYELVIRYFEPLQKDLGWGCSLLYLLGARYNIHPTYIQNLLSGSRFGVDEIVGAIDYLSRLENPSNYSELNFFGAVGSNITDNNLEPSGSNAIQGVFDGKDVLLVGNGPSCKRYADDIEFYIREHKPVVVSINIATWLPAELIDYYVITHNSKYLSDSSRYKDLNGKIIMPLHRFSGEELQCINYEYFDYGIKVQPGEMHPHASYAVVPYDVTTAYALVLLLESRPKSILCVGFDGFEKNDVRQQEMLEIIDRYNRIENSVELVALTPTSYPMKKSSVYAPLSPL